MGLQPGWLFQQRVQGALPAGHTVAFGKDSRGRSTARVLCGTPDRARKLAARLDGRYDEVTVDGSRVRIAQRTSA